jgi:hypothetical protein
MNGYGMARCRPFDVGSDDDDFPQRGDGFRQNPDSRGVNAIIVTE